MISVDWRRDKYLFLCGAFNAQAAAQNDPICDDEETNLFYSQSWRIRWRVSP